MITIYSNVAVQTKFPKKYEPILAVSIVEQVTIKNKILQIKLRYYSFLPRDQ